MPLIGSFLRKGVLMCIEPSLDLALEPFINVLSIIINLLCTFQQVAGTELGSVRNKSLSLGIYNPGRASGVYVPKMCWATHRREKLVRAWLGWRAQVGIQDRRGCSHLRRVGRWLGKTWGLLEV